MINLRFITTGIRRAINAFTLAEVLITLAIIGVVAAMTIPAVLHHQRKTVVETRLKKFYSEMNQAIQLAELENGDKTLWTPEDTNDFWNNYISKYLHYIKVEERMGKQKIVYLPDGSAVVMDIYYAATAEGEVMWRTYGGNFQFCPEAQDCSESNFSNTSSNYSGTKLFRFGFWPNESKTDFKYHKDKGVEPYRVWWDGDLETLYTNTAYGCNVKSSNRAYCAAVIQNNGWKIPDDYPFGF